MNKVILSGRLGADPELKTTSSGLQICNLRVATSERRKQGEEWVDHTEWHRVAVFGRRGEFIAGALAKGSFVVVEGKLRTSSYEKDGDKRYSTSIAADSVEFDRKAEGSSSPAPGFADADGGGDDDIPF